MGFSLIGTIIAIMILLPNLLFFVKFKPRNTPVPTPAESGRNVVGFILTELERIGQISCFAILIVSKDNFRSVEIGKNDFWAVLMLLCIAVYYFLWIRYIAKGQDYAWLWKPLFFVPIPMAVFPVLAFGFAALWVGSVWLGVAAAILAAGHIPISWQSYKKVRIS